MRAGGSRGICGRFSFFYNSCGSLLLPRVAGESPFFFLIEIPRGFDGEKKLRRIGTYKNDIMSGGVPKGFFFSAAGNIHS